MKMFSKVLKTILALSMMMSVLVLTPNMEVLAKTELVNVALNDGVKATSLNGENGNYVIGNIIDGDPSTSWQTKGAWPSVAVIELDMGRTIEEVVVEFGEDGDYSSGNTCLVTVEYAQNGVVSDLIPFGSYRMNVDSTYTFKADTPKSATHIYVTLSDPQDKNGNTPTFWPSVQEVGVYESQDVSLSAFNNIAAHATISATGGNEHSSEGSKNLVDNNTSTLYKYYNAAQTSEQSVTLKFDEERTMDAFAIAFENVGQSDSIGFKFVYSILARKGSGEYVTIVDHAQANRTDQSSQSYKINAAVYDEVKIVMHSCTTSSGNGWPAIAEFEVYGNEITTNDGESIAYKKPVHTSSNANTALNVNDGSTRTSWSGIYYPSYVDIDLEENYYLNEIKVFTPTNGYSQYSFYTSLD